MKKKDSYKVGYRRKISTRTLYISLLMRTELVLTLFLVLTIISFVLLKFLFPAFVGREIENSTIIFLGLLLASAVVAIGIPFIYEIVANRVYDKDDIKELGSSAIEIRAGGKNKRKKEEEMKNPFKEKTRYEMIQHLMNIESRNGLVDKLTALIDEIEMDGEVKVLGITSVEDDSLTAAFAKGLMDAYAINGSSTLLIDANVYSPFLEKHMRKQGDILENKMGNTTINGNIGVVFMKESERPEEVLKSGEIEVLIKAQKTNYGHILLLLPSLKEHREAASFNAVFDGVVLVVRRDVTERKDIAKAIDFLDESGSKLKKVVVLK